MQHWQEFKDSRFALSFRFPEVTPQGHSVDIAETSQPDSVRVHLTSPGSREVYFEIAKYDGLTPDAEYRQHRISLEERFAEFGITNLTEIQWRSSLAREYSFRWNEGERVVVLVEHGGSTYRVIYDPRSSLNTQILSTIEWIA